MHYIRYLRLYYLMLGTVCGMQRKDFIYTFIIKENNCFKMKTFTTSIDVQTVDTTYENSFCFVTFQFVLLKFFLSRCYNLLENLSLSGLSALLLQETFYKTILYFIKAGLSYWCVLSSINLSTISRLPHLFEEESSNN